MRRLAPFLGIAFILAGCGGSETVLPTAKTVIGTVPTATQASVPKGDPEFDPTATGTQVIFLDRSNYDPTTGKYGAIISRVLQLSALATILVLGIFMMVLIRQGSRPDRHAEG